MTFAAPLFLLAALAAAIPIVMHMIHRRRAKELPFATVRFLKVCVEKTRRRKRIHDVLLLALRAGLLMLIAVGLARPALIGLGAWGGARGAAAVLILDNSASMGLVDQDRPRFDVAQEAAAAILDQYAEGDRVALLPACGPPLPEADRLDASQIVARRNLALCRVGYQRAELDAKLQHAQRLLADSDAANKHIYVITDMQRASWENRGERRGERREGRNERGEETMGLPSPFGRGAGGEGDKKTDHPPTISSIIVVCGRAGPPHVAVEGVQVELSAPLAGMPATASVALRNTSTVGQRPRVELWLDGVRHASSPELNVPPEGRATHEFTFTLRESGLHRGEVRLAGADGSAFDDRRFFAVRIVENVPVAVVRTPHEIPHLDDAYYLENVLATGGRRAIETTMLAPGDLLGEPLDRYKAIFCVNLPALDAESAERLRAYLVAGGRVVWIAGDRVEPEAYNRMNRRAKGQLLPVSLGEVRRLQPGDSRDSWHIERLDPSFPALGRLVEPPSLYESVLVYQYIAAVPDPLQSARELARLDAGEPLMVLGGVERGKTLWFGAAMHANWSNLPLRPIFLPLVVRLTLELAETATGSVRHVVVGAPLKHELPDRKQTVGVEVVRPGGETLRIQSQEAPRGDGQVFYYADTFATGIYLVRPMDAPAAAATAFCANYDPAEADPARIDRRELEQRFDGAPLLMANNPGELSAIFLRLREGTSLWGAVLTLVLVALVCETYFANRLSRKPPGPVTIKGGNSGD